MSRGLVGGSHVETKRALLRLQTRHMRRTPLLFLLLLSPACADEPEQSAAPAGAPAPASTAAASSRPSRSEPADAPDPQATGGAPHAQPPAVPGPGEPRPSGVRLAIVSGLSGSLTQQQVEQTIAGARGALSACYGGAEARIEASIQISPSGEVGEAAIRRSEPGQPKQKECAEAQLAKLHFPPPNASLKLELGIFLEPPG